MSTIVRKSIIPLACIDLGGVHPRAEELCTIEVLGQLSAIYQNSSLLKEDDPFREEFLQFINTVSNNPIIITNADIDLGDSTSYFDNIDLSGISLKSEGFDNLGHQSYISNRLWSSGTFNSTIFPPTGYIEPTGERTVMRMMGEDMEFIWSDHEFEPQCMNDVTSLSLFR